MAATTSTHFNECLMDTVDIERELTRIAHEILEHNKDTQQLALVGIVRRGEALAQMLCERIEHIRGTAPYFGVLDTSFYRDDYSYRVHPVQGASTIPFEVDACHVVLVDDVLFTGRTIRSAIDALMDYGRPATIQLAILVDRGLRELPIRADYVGLSIHTSAEDDIRVLVPPIDEALRVELWQASAHE